MANTVITSTNNTVCVEFNDDAPKVGNIVKGCYNKTDILYLNLFADHIEVVAGNTARWIVCNTTNNLNAVIVDNVNGVMPTSLSDLYDKLKALIA